MIRFNGLRTVTGAAHTNWSMFGSRGPCLEGADGGGSGAAPPAPLPSGDPPAPTPNPAPTPAPTGEPTFTPEQQAVINKLVGQARVEGRNAAQAAQKQPAPQPAPTPQPEPKMTIEALAQRLADTELRARFDKRAFKRGLDDDAADDLFELYRVQKPTDDENWFAERERRLGLKRSTSATTPPETQPPVTAPTTPIVQSAAPISNQGAPAPAGAIGWRFELQQNPMNMSPAAKQAMNTELGEEKARKMRLEAARPQAERMRVITRPQG